MSNWKVHPRAQPVLSTTIPHSQKYAYGSLPSFWHDIPIFNQINSGQPTLAQHYYPDYFRHFLDRQYPQSFTEAKPICDPLTPNSKYNNLRYQYYYTLHTTNASYQLEIGQKDVSVQNYLHQLYTDLQVEVSKLTWKAAALDGSTIPQIANQVIPQSGILKWSTVCHPTLISLGDYVDYILQNMTARPFEDYNVSVALSCALDNYNKLLEEMFGTVNQLPTQQNTFGWLTGFHLAMAETIDHGIQSYDSNFKFKISSTIDQAPHLIGILARMIMSKLFYVGTKPTRFLNEIQIAEKEAFKIRNPRHIISTGGSSSSDLTTPIEQLPYPPLEMTKSAIVLIKLLLVDFMERIAVMEQAVCTAAFQMTEIVRAVVTAVINYGDGNEVYNAHKTALDTICGDIWTVAFPDRDDTAGWKPQPPPANLNPNPSSSSSSSSSSSLIPSQQPALTPSQNNPTTGNYFSSPFFPSPNGNAFGSTNGQSPTVVYPVGTDITTIIQWLHSRKSTGQPQFQLPNPSGPQVSDGGGRLPFSYPGSRPPPGPPDGNGNGGPNGNGPSGNPRISGIPVVANINGQQVQMYLGNGSSHNNGNHKAKFDPSKLQDLKSYGSEQNDKYYSTAEDFIQAFEDHMKYYSADDETKIHAFGSKLTGIAKAWYDNLSSVSKLNYYQFRDEFWKNCSPNSTRNQTRSSFYKCKQEAHETAQTFYSRLYHLRSIINKNALVSSPTVLKEAAYEAQGYKDACTARYFRCDPNDYAEQVRLRTEIDQADAAYKMILATIPGYLSESEMRAHFRNNCHELLVIYIKYELDPQDSLGMDQLLLKVTAREQLEKEVAKISTTDNTPGQPNKKQRQNRQERRNRKIGGVTDKAYDKFCYNCGADGHFAANCSKGSGPNPKDENSLAGLRSSFGAGVSNIKKPNSEQQSDMKHYLQYGSGASELSIPAIIGHLYVPTANLDSCATCCVMLLDHFNLYTDEQKLMYGYQTTKSNSETRLELISKGKEVIPVGYASKVPVRLGGHWAPSRLVIFIPFFIVKDLNYTVLIGFRMWPGLIKSIDIQKQRVYFMDAVKPTYCRFNQRRDILTTLEAIELNKKLKHTINSYTTDVKMREAISIEPHLIFGSTPYAERRKDAKRVLLGQEPEKEEKEEEESETETEEDYSQSAPSSSSSSSSTTTRRKVPKKPGLSTAPPEPARAPTVALSDEALEKKEREEKRREGESSTSALVPSSSSSSSSSSSAPEPYPDEAGSPGQKRRRTVVKKGDKEKKQKRGRGKGKGKKEQQEGSKRVTRSSKTSETAAAPSSSASPSSSSSSVPPSSSAAPSSSSEVSSSSSAAPSSSSSSSSNSSDRPHISALHDNVSYGSTTLNSQAIMDYINAKSSKYENQ